MLYLSKKLFSLLALLPPATLASSAVTKTFKFKEDFFIKFNPLPTAIGPDASVDVLMSALNGFAQQFQEVWIGSLKSNLQGGLCTVDQMRMNLPEFLMCDWKYPDRYDIDELPTPGQCYVYRNGFVQRIYYKIEELEITCPEDFSYEDLDKAAYTEAAFSGQDFLNVIKPASTDCDGNLFSGVDTVEWVTGYDVCNTTLYINRFVDVPVYLKCLDTDGYDRNIANELIKALDEYFELVVSKILAEKIMQQAPKGFIYNFASPYASDREYCAHGAYYAGGNLVDQVPDNDGTLITRFTYGFDVIWYKPRDFHDELLPGLEYIINEAFEEGEFLLFLQKEYPDSDFIEDIGFCDVIDPDEAEVTFAPTEEPTSQPTEGPICDVDTNNHCLAGQVCRLSCVWRSSEPQCFEDEEERDCTGKWGPGWICLDTNKDGIISASENSDGCQYASPTTSPSESPTPTTSPSESPTPSPVLPIVITSSPTLLPSTQNPTDLPSLRPVTLSPTISYPPSKFIAPSASPSHTSKPSSEPTPLPSSRLPTLNPTPVPSSRPPTLNPTILSTLGDTDTVNTVMTLSPTPLQVRPAETRYPTTSPIEDSSPSTPSPTCPKCIVHPDDTEEDECPIVTTGTCSDGDRGDGICPYAGYCCSKWGYCGTTSEYCDDDSVAPSPSDVEGAPLAPTYSVDAGQCASGEIGDGFCPDEFRCCSDWGYCGSGESYCFSTRVYDEDSGEPGDGTCGGGGVGDGDCNSGFCCSRFGFCGEGELYCTGQNGLESDAIDEAEEIINSSPLPDDRKPGFGFRCGITEVDARSNCNSECSHHIKCSDGEECWGIQLNYCSTFEEGEHPICINLDLADDDSRCGHDEISARGHCGLKCKESNECNEGEYCFPTLLNLCMCHEGTCPENVAIFAKAKALISPYFVERDTENHVEGEAGGKPRNASFKLISSVATSFLLVFATMHFLMM